MYKNTLKIALFIVWFLPTISYTQIFPVQVNPQIRPPYAVKIADYSTSSNEKIVLNLLLSDINELNRQIGVKVYVESNSGLAVQSSENAITSLLPFHIDGGTPLRLTNLDFKENFDLQNLQGITPQQYAQSLPDGFYQFCFEIYDWFSKQPISDKSCVSVNIAKNAPPLLNIPFKGDLVPRKIPQNLIFQWTPRHVDAVNVQYEFTLVELWDKNMDPQAAFLSGRPLYQEITTANTFLYGPGETALIPNTTYAWRVRAVLGNSIGETSPFENDGYSEIFHFSYTGNCDEPQQVLSQFEGSNSVRITWQGVDHRHYQIQYRKKGQNAEWFTNKMDNEYATLYNLEKGLPYEFRVGGQCSDNNTGFVYSQIYDFYMQPGIAGDKGYNCGITPEIEITSDEPLKQIGINEVFLAGDFPVTVKEVYESYGKFRGWGYIIVPYLEDTKIKVSFNDIGINKDYQLMSGVVITDYDKDWGGVDDVSDEIQAIGLLAGGAIDILESVIETLKAGNLKAADLDKFLDKVEGTLPIDEIAELKKIKDKIGELEEAFKNADTKKEEAEIQSQITALNKEFEATLKAIRDKMVDIIVKAFIKFYNDNSDKDNEDKLIKEYEYYIVHNPQTVAPPFVANSDTNEGSNEGSENSSFDIEFEGEVQLATVSTEMKKRFDTEERFHLYFFSKSIALSEGDNASVVKSFIKKSLESEIDIIEIIKKAQDGKKSDEELISIMSEAVENALKQLINKHKYDYLKT